MLTVGSVVRHKRIKCAMTIQRLLDKNAQCIYFIKRECHIVYLPLKELF